MRICSGSFGARFFFRLLVVVAVVFRPSELAASGSDFGVTGYLDMPSARMADDGTFRTTISAQQSLQLYNLTYQAFPWLEATFRYAILNPGDLDRSRDDLRDRSYAVKMRLLRERRLAPELAIGLQDALGTGVFGSEYLVASKRIGNLDASLGIGWGRYAGSADMSNPLEYISEEFGDRRAFQDGEQGQPLTGTFFRGPNVGFFGGARYEIPKWRLALIGEFHGDKFRREVSLGTLDEVDRFSVGVEWEPAKDITLTLSHQLGQEWGLTVSADLNTRLDAPIKREAAFWSADDARSEPPPGLDLGNWYARLLFDVERSGLQLRRAEVSDEGRVVWLEIANTRYQYTADAIRQVLSLAELHLPRGVHTINVVLEEYGLQMSALSYKRRLDYDAFDDSISPGAVIDVIPPRRLDRPRYETGYQTPALVLTAEIATRFQLMDPDDPLRYQAALRVGTRVNLPAGFAIRGSTVLNLYNDFDDIDRDSDSVLPRVRSDISRYLKEGDTGIDSLYLEYRSSVRRDLHVRGYAGVLEEMYTGVGGEVLYQPFASRLAFGATINYLWQRDFDKDFGLRDYETATAFASLYWATPFSNYDFAIHAGRYLAKDVGATIEVRRTFANGWSVGGWATLTDVPFDEFGEGSFDKGLFFRIPFNQILPGNTRASYATSIRPVQRDGGQRTENFGSTIWWNSRSVRPDALVRTRARMIP